MAIGNPQPKNLDDPLLTEEQVAAYLRISPRFVQERLGHLAKRGYRKEDVNDWMRAQPQLPPRGKRRDVRGKVCTRRGGGDVR